MNEMNEINEINLSESSLSMPDTSCSILASTITVEVVITPAAFHALEKPWQDLYQQALKHNFFQSFSWASAWWDNLGEQLGYSLCVVTIKQAGKLVLIWPLVKRRQGLWQVGSWIGAESGQYGDVLLAESSEQSAWLDRAWDSVNNDLGLDILKLADIRADAAIAPYLEQKLGSPTASSAGPYCGITEWQDWDTFYAGLKRRFRKDLRRCRRRLQEQGELVFQLIDNADEIAEVVALSLRHKRVWFEERGIYGRFMERTEAQQWMIQACLAAHKNQSLVLSVLKLNDKVIATTIAFLDRNHLYNYFGSFDLDFNNHSAGMLQTEDALRWAFDNDIAVFDLMPPNDQYKLSLARCETIVVVYTVYPSILGYAARIWYAAGLREYALQLYRRLPRGLRQSVAQWVVG